MEVIPIGGMMETVAAILIALGVVALTFLVVFFVLWAAWLVLCSL
jgi:hypothetical protein